MRCSAHTTAQSDSSETCRPAVRLLAFSGRSRSWLDREIPEVSRFSYMLLLSVRGFLDYAEAADHSRFSAVSRIAFSTGDMPTPVDGERVEHLKARIRHALGSRSAYAIEFNPQSPSPIPDLIRKHTLKTQTEAQFVKASQTMANYLHEQQV